MADDIDDISVELADTAMRLAKGNKTTAVAGLVHAFACLGVAAGIDDFVLTVAVDEALVQALGSRRDLENRGLA